jgi:hypothetical protein
MSDPNFYRKYECNIECYKMKASKKFRCATCELGDAQADSLTTSNLVLSPGLILTYTGLFPLSSTHVLTPTLLPVLGNRECNGEITLYMNNDIYVNVTMAAIVKAAGSILQTLVYQRVGNFTSIDVSFSGNNVTITINPAATCRWIYRGI